MGRPGERCEVSMPVERSSVPWARESEEVSGLWDVGADASPATKGLRRKRGREGEVWRRGP